MRTSSHIETPASTGRSSSCDTPYASNRRNFEHTKIKEKENHEKSKYELKCPKCGHIFYRNRMSKIVKNPGNYWHIEYGENYRLIRIK